MLHSVSFGDMSAQGQARSRATTKIPITNHKAKPSNIAAHSGTRRTPNKRRNSRAVFANNSSARAEIKFSIQGPNARSAKMLWRRMEIFPVSLPAVDAAAAPRKGFRTSGMRYTPSR